MTDLPLRAGYDAVHYHGRPVPEASVERLQAIATLYGADPVPCQQARILELGCAVGAHLLPMAHRHPEATFVGVDFSAGQIAVAEEGARALGLNNARFLCADIESLPKTLGSFDYVIAHGVYSWVAPEVAEALLGAIARHLSSHGVGYISYNTFPGWYDWMPVRDALGDHLREVDDPQSRVDAIAPFLRDYARLLPPGERRQTVESLLGRDPSYILHDHASTHLNPIYFRDMAQALEKVGLQHVAETSFLPHQIEPLLESEQVRSIHALGHTRTEREALRDTAVQRRFRQSLVCRAGLKVHANPEAKALTRLWIAAPEGPAKADELAPGKLSSWEYGGARMQSTHALTKAAYYHLASVWPRALSVKEVLEGAMAALMAYANTDPQDVKGTDLGIALESMMGVAFTRLTTFLGADPGAQQAPEEGMAVACPVARWQGAQQEWVCNRHHQPVALGEDARVLLPYLNGGPLRDIASADGQIWGPDRVYETTEELARMGVLVG